MCEHAVFRVAQDTCGPTKQARWKIGPAVIGFGLLTSIYIGGLAYLDRNNHVFEHGIDVASVLPQVALFSLASFLLRNWRWRWLLGRRDLQIQWFPGLLAYVSGFALTASPGKVGELMRVRYFGAMGVRADHVIACFVFERMLDLIVLLMLATPLASLAPGMAIAFSFVILVFVAIVILSRTKSLWISLARWFREARWDGAARLSLTVGRGLMGAIDFFRPNELAVSMLLGLSAWTIQSFGCLYLLVKLGIVAPPLMAIALYPLALLIGAASMLPGGVGTTEASIILLLHGFGTPFNRAAIAAIGMRLSTLWFAIALGLLAIPVLELMARRPGARHDALHKSKSSAPPNA